MSSVVGLLVILILIIEIVSYFKRKIEGDKRGKKPSLETAIRSIKKQIYTVQEDAGRPDNQAMFSLGAVTIDLKTVIGENNEIKVVGGNENIGTLEKVLGSSNELTQNISITLNPLKVFSEKLGSLEVIEGETIIQEKKYIPHIIETKTIPAQNSYYERVTEADFITIEDKNYLWIREEDNSETWIESSRIKKIKSSVSKPPKYFIAMILEEIFWQNNKKQLGDVDLRIHKITQARIEKDFSQTQITITNKNSDWFCNGLARIFCSNLNEKILQQITKNYVNNKITKISQEETQKSFDDLIQTTINTKINNDNDNNNDNDESLKYIASYFLPMDDLSEIRNIAMSLNEFYCDYESESSDENKATIISKFNNTDNAYKKFLLRFLCDKEYISSKNCSTSTDNRLQIELKDLELAYINMTFANSNLNDWTKITSLSKIDLKGATLKNIQLGEASNSNQGKQQGINLTEAILISAKLQNSELPKAKLNNANLTDAKLQNSNLTGADLTGAYLTQEENTTEKISLNSDKFKQMLIKAKNYDLATYKKDDEENKAYIDGLNILANQKASTSQ